MYRKLFVFILLASSACSLTIAQTPVPKAKGETRVFSTFFDGVYLGVQTEEVTKENFSKFGLSGVRGVAVENVVEGSPAQTAGLQNGDVIVKFNGEEITSVRKLTRLIGEVAPDHQAKIIVFRGGSEREITATLATRPTPKFGEGSFSFAFPNELGKIDAPDLPNLQKLPRVQIAPRNPGDSLLWSFGSRRHIGIGVTPLTKQLGEHFGVDSGIMVNNVREDSPAAKAGLKAGDIIVEADGKAVKSDGDLIRAIHEKKEGDVTLTIVRDRSRQTIRVTPEEAKGGFNTFFEFQDAPNSPDVPGNFKMVRPVAPAAPMPLNQLFVPGRVI